MRSRVHTDGAFATEEEQADGAVLSFVARWLCELAASNASWCTPAGDSSSSSSSSDATGRAEHFWHEMLYWVLLSVVLVRLSRLWM